MTRAGSWSRRGPIDLAGRSCPLGTCSELPGAGTQTFRDAVGSGAAPDSPELADAIQSYGTVLRALRHALRDEPGEPRLDTDVSN